MHEICSGSFQSLSYEKEKKCAERRDTGIEVIETEINRLLDEIIEDFKEAQETLKTQTTDTKLRRRGKEIAEENVV